MHSQERVEFIEKFKREHNIDPLNKNNINTSSITYNNTKTRQNVNNSNTINNSQHYQTNNSNNLNVSKGSQYLSNQINKSKIMNNNNLLYNKSTGPRRWDHLHQLAKSKQTALANKKLKQKEDDEYKFKSECTFNPTFYTKKSYSKSKYNLKTSPNENYVTTTCNSNNINSNTSLNDAVNIDGLNNKNNEFTDDIINCDVNQRTVIWSRKKEVKNENIKQQLINKEIEECYFAPTIVSYFQLHYNIYNKY